jgi:aldehyde dehydrogenase
MAAHDDYQDKALEGFTMFALNQGEVCTCPSRSLIQSDIYDEFLALAAIRTKAVRQGDPLDTETMIGAQASNDQLERILSHIEIGKSEGAKVITGGERADLGGDLSGGYYVAPTVFTGNNKMRIFQEEIFGPVVAVTSFTDYDDAISIANDTRSTAWVPGCGAATATSPTGPAGTSRPAGCGPTATTRIRRTRRSVATSSRASAVRPTR